MWTKTRYLFWSSPFTHSTCSTYSLHPLAPFGTSLSEFFFPRFPFLNRSLFFNIFVYTLRLPFSLYLQPFSFAVPCLIFENLWFYWVCLFILIFESVLQAFFTSISWVFWSFCCSTTMHTIYMCFCTDCYLFTWVRFIWRWKITIEATLLWYFLFCPR